MGHIEIRLHIQRIMNEFHISLEDRPGALAECCEAIGAAGINIVSGAAMGESSSALGVLVTAEADETAAALDSVGASYTMHSLHSAVLVDAPGSLGKFTRELANDGVNLRSLHIMKTDSSGVHIGYSTE